MRRILITICTTLIISGCSVYKVDVRQGNTLEVEKVAQLKEGMTKKQVQFLLGSAQLKDAFHPNRWDYIYTFTPGGQEIQRHHMTLHFSGDTLVKIDKSELKEELMERKPQ